MGTAKQDQKEVSLHLKKQLALAVRSICWNYAIFWALSPGEPRRFVWYDGYYNGEIKTRKTVQSAESSSDELGLQRSDQLRELYESLSLGESNHPAKRPTAALVPEDLSNAEWYFLVCMLYKFETGQGLPGRSRAKNEAIWVCNAHRADPKLFPRTLLAKSADIQTIVCFPHMGGVVEIGTTELVEEDMSLISHVKDNFLNSPCPNSDTNDHFLNNQALLQDSNPGDAIDHLLDSPDSDQEDNNLMLEESDLAVSQVLNWQSTEDAISNCLDNCSDSISQTLEDPETINSSDLNETDLQYLSLLSRLPKCSRRLVLGPSSGNGSSQSSFVNWTGHGFRRTKPHVAQNLLKKVLIEVPRMWTEPKQSRNARPEADENDRNHVLSERKRREKINERFLILGSIIPSGGKVDKVSILDNTIEYLQELERKVGLGGMHSYKEATPLESSTAETSRQDAIERTSDNYGSNETGETKKVSTRKRKQVGEAEKKGGKGKKAKHREQSADDVAVQVSDKDVLIESRCCWTDSMIVEAMAAVSKLRLDIRSFETSNVDGILSMTIKAKCKGLKAPSASVVKQALQKAIAREVKKGGG